MAKEYITIRVPKELKEDIEDLAGKERRSVSQMALMLLELGLKDKLKGATEPKAKGKFPNLPVVG
jgi:predicted transcriptional regulator